MDDIAVSTEPATTRARTVPIWAAFAATLAAVLVAFAVGYGINADDAGAASERDDLREKVERTSAARNRARTALEVAQAAVDECQAAVEDAADLAEDADDLSGSWLEVKDLGVDYGATAVGSAAEIEIEEKVAELMLQIDTKVGALAASAERVDANTGCRES